MSWYAECKRRHWYCILEWDAISWYSNYLYNQWYASLTKEQKEKLKQYENVKTFVADILNDIAKENESHTYDFNSITIFLSR